MILDRAKLDGAAFWPPGPEDYLLTYKVDLNKELAAYDHVLFLEMPEEKYFGGVHKTRFHDYKQSMESQKKLEQVWSKHPHFIRIQAQADFSKKVENVLQAVAHILATEK